MFLLIVGYSSCSLCRLSATMLASSPLLSSCGRCFLFLLCLLFSALAPLRLVGNGACLPVLSVLLRLCFVPVLCRVFSPRVPPGGVWPSWALLPPAFFRPAVARCFYSRACCSPAVSPHPCFWGGDKPAPKTSLTVGTPWAVCSPSPSLLVSWVGGLSSGGVGSSSARRCRKNDYIYFISAPLSARVGVCFPQSPYQIQYRN